MSDPELKELFRKLREELNTASRFECTSIWEHERAKHISAITEAESIADEIYRELDLREAERVIRAA